MSQKTLLFREARKVFGDQLRRVEVDWCPSGRENTFRVVLQDRVFVFLDCSLHQAVNQLRALGTELRKNKVDNLKSLS